jgi:type IV fimbrial biogenesis protein FimT
MMKTRMQGLTLIELMVALVISGIMVALAMPSFLDVIERRRVDGAGNELSTDLQYARSLSVARNTSVALTTAADGLSYTIADTSGGTTHKTVSLYSSLSVTPSVTITYENIRGTSNATYIEVSSTSSTDKIRVVTNIMGRVQICVPSGNIAGYSSC